MWWTKNALQLESISFLNDRILRENIYRMEHQANLLWINSDSSYNIHEEWLQQHFKKNERPQVLIVKSENVLTPEIINKVCFYVVCVLCWKGHKAWMKVLNWFSMNPKSTKSNHSHCFPRKIIKVCLPTVTLIPLVYEDCLFIIFMNFQMYDVYQEIMSINSYGKTFDDICAT